MRVSANYADGLEARIKELEADNARMRARSAELEAALRPFAAIDLDGADWRDHDLLCQNQPTLTVGAVRRARAVLGK